MFLVNVLPSESRPHAAFAFAKDVAATRRPSIGVVRTCVIATVMQISMGLSLLFGGKFLLSLMMISGLALCVVLVRMIRELNRRQAQAEAHRRELAEAHHEEYELRKALDRKQAMLKLIVDTVPQGVFWKDADGRVIGCNTAMAHTLGFDDAEQLINLDRPDGPGPQSTIGFESFRSDDRHILETGHSLLEYEEHVQRADGVTITLLVSKVPIRIDGGAVIGVLGSCVDITQRKQQEQQRAHAQKMESIGQLAAGVAHEINTPTQFVSENMRFLGEAINKFQRIIAQQERFADPNGPRLDWAQRHQQLHQLKREIDYDFIDAEAPRAVQESLDGLDRIREIVTAMREFSHPGDDADQPFDLNRVIQTSATVCRNRWKYVAQIEFDLDPELPTAHGHAGELGQAIVNLIVNAADAIETNHTQEAGFNADGRIYLTTRCDNDWIQIVVRDNGPGVPQHMIPKVFDPFFTTKGVGEGTGQGLAITHQVVVVKHHGEIELHNHPDGGACFTLRLPRKPTHKLAAVEAALASSGL